MRPLCPAPSIFRGRGRHRDPVVSSNHPQLPSTCMSPSPDHFSPEEPSCFWNVPRTMGTTEIDRVRPAVCPGLRSRICVRVTIFFEFALMTYGNGPVLYAITEPHEATPCTVRDRTAVAGRIRRASGTPFSFVGVESVPKPVTLMSRSDRSESCCPARSDCQRARIAAPQRENSPSPHGGRCKNSSARGGIAIGCSWPFLH